MSNRHVQELSKVYEGLFEDALYAYPTLGDEFERDLVRLREAVLQRGLYLYLVDLPALCKHLDRCLDNGEYKLSGLPLSKRYSNRTPIPKFLRGLYLLVFDSLGSLKEDYDVTAIFFLRQILSAAKKVCVPCSSEAVVNEVDDFFAIDERLPEPEWFWQCPHPTRSEVGENYRGFCSSTVVTSREGCSTVSNSEEGGLVSLLRSLDKVSNILSTTLGVYDPSEWSFKHGPGAIADHVGPTNKYCWFNWSDRLESVFPIADYGFHNYSSWACDVGDREITTNEPSSRLISVPKSYTKPRLIAAEPRENQWCQQNIWRYFFSRTESTWIGRFIRFADQTLNQDLCQKGSASGMLATVDLSAASDRVTPHVVGQLYRGNPGLVLALQSSRTRVITQKISSNAPSEYVLRKFSTMGSACTFPVESHIFLSVALAAVLTTRQLPVTLRNITDLEGSVAVFGDDIVIPIDCRESLIQLLEALCFKVNINKSYWNGKFRESCGVDSFGGVDLTPAYWKGKIGNDPDSIASTIDASNNFYMKFLVNTSNVVASTIRKINIPFVGVESGVTGFKSFVRPPRRHKERWNGDLQLTESLVPVFLTKAQKTPTNDDSALLQFFTEEPSPLLKWSHGFVQRPKTKLRLTWVPTSELIAQ
jgi:hypothetical protein